MNKVLIVVGFVAATAAVLYFARQGQGTERKPGGEVAQPVASGDRTEVTFVYSTEKKEWIDAALEAFAKEEPSVAVKAKGMGSLQAAEAILAGKEKPVLWSPADSLVMNLFDADWKTKHQTQVLGTGDDAPNPLVITPLVFVAWEDRAQALTKTTGGKLSFKTIHDAVASPRGWPAVGGKEEWGFVKLGHTDPTLSNSGLQALFLMSLEFHGKRAGLEVGDLLKPDYQKWVQELEKGVPTFETSTGTFMTDMIRFGPSKYDIAVVYENLAISQLENAQGRWGNLRIYYPAITLWSDHPITVLQGDWVTEPQRQAARKLVTFLRSRRMQERALSFGFRPADPAVPLKTADAANPYTRLAQFGVQLELPPATPAPPGAVIRNMMTMWSRMVAR